MTDLTPTTGLSINTGLTLTDKNRTGTSASDTSHACGCGAAGSACACGTGAHGHADAHAESGHPTAGHIGRYLVSGMTCSHCVSSVTEELSEIDGVQFVKVDLNAGGVSRVRVVSDAPVDASTIRSAVEEAGYELVDAGA